jgi:riboflavin kinase/FMN adenylyltransferase
MNIGFNPTVAGEIYPFHYFNFNSDLYDQEIAVSIINIYALNKIQIDWLIESTIGKDKISLAYLS